MASVVEVVAAFGAVTTAARNPMWEAQRLEADTALPLPPDIDNEFPVLRWKSEDYVPPPKP